MDEMSVLGTVPLSRDWLGVGKDYFFLRIKGDAMGDALQPGDLVLVERIGRSTELANGELVVAVVDDEAICRRYFLHTDGLYLRADHPRTPTQVLPRDFKLLGKVKAMVRKYQ